MLAARRPCMHTRPRCAPPPPPPPPPCRRTARRRSAARRWCWRRLSTRPSAARRSCSARSTARGAARACQRSFTSPPTSGTAPPMQVAGGRWDGWVNGGQRMPHWACRQGQHDVCTRSPLEPAPARPALARRPHHRPRGAPTQGGALALWRAGGQGVHHAAGRAARRVPRAGQRHPALLLPGPVLHPHAADQGVQDPRGHVHHAGAPGACGGPVGLVGCLGRGCGGRTSSASAAVHACPLTPTHPPTTTLARPQVKKVQYNGDLVEAAWPLGAALNALGR